MSGSFSAFCSEIGMPLRNERWSWSAINEERRQAVFTIWKDRLNKIGQDTIDLTDLYDPNRTENGAREFRRIMNHVLHDDYTPFGILCEAVDPTVRPRQRRNFERKLLVLKVFVDSDKVKARIVGFIEPASVTADRGVVEILADERSAIDDLNVEPTGVPQPQRSQAVTSFFPRDDKVRARVLKRALGRCEHCGATGFLKPDGSAYLESHHIISVSEQGPDTLDNVIALCPGHHREAHYGANRLALEQALLEKLANLRAKQ